MKDQSAVKTVKIISTGIAGTTFMTLFTYIVAENKKKNFKEPKILAQLLDRLLPETDRKCTQIGGWSLHYAMGFLFATFYSELWEQKKIKPNLKNALLLGGLSGLAGSMVWKLTFKIHPDPPRLHFQKYYQHLLLAHLVFAIFATMGNRLIQAKDR